MKLIHLFYIRYLIFKLYPCQVTGIIKLQIFKFPFFFSSRATSHMSTGGTRF